MRAVSRNLDLVFEQEVVAGTINGTNTAFTIAFTPEFAKELVLYLDGIPLTQVTDYTISGKNITMGTAPALGQDLFATYMRSN